jgi:hypothetical protein
MAVKTGGGKDWCGRSVVEVMLMLLVVEVGKKIATVLLFHNKK